MGGACDLGRDHLARSASRPTSARDQRGCVRDRGKYHLPPDHQFDPQFRGLAGYSRLQRRHDGCGADHPISAPVRSEHRGGCFADPADRRKLFLPFLAATAAALLLNLNLAPPNGLIQPDDQDLRTMLFGQAMINTFVINALIMFYALAALHRAEAELENQ